MIRLYTTTATYTKFEIRENRPERIAACLVGGDKFYTLSATKDRITQPDGYTYNYITLAEYKMIMGAKSTDPQEWNFQSSPGNLHFEQTSG